MKIFSLEIRRAQKGDCLLLHFGTEAETGLVMIDGGPKSVYQSQLKPCLDRIKLNRIKKGRSLAEPVMVDLLMVSHLDDDHIQGILDLTREELTAKDARRAKMLNVLSFWHNSFGEIIDQDPKELTGFARKHFGEAALSGGGELPDTEMLKIEEESPEHPEVVESGLKVLASIAQGYRLRQDAEALGYKRNLELGGKLIMARKNGKPINIAHGLTFTVVGPMQKDLEALYKKHVKWLEDLPKKGKAPSSALAAYIDRSVTNLSSIVVLAEFAGKRVLLTGDARGDKIIQGLQLVGLLGRDQTSKIEVDILKVPHHGSANNLGSDFFKRIVAKYYVFSGNGEHGNPERESLKMLLAERSDNSFEIHFTYPIDEIDDKRKQNWEQEQAKEEKQKKVKIREDWSPDQHSLKSLLATRQDLATKIRIVKKCDPDPIDLFDNFYSDNYHTR